MPDPNEDERRRVALAQAWEAGFIFAGCPLPETPESLSCPECGAPEDLRYGDPEGACQCVNGHAFWDTNAPEWKAIRAREADKIRDREVTVINDRRYVALDAATAMLRATGAPEAAWAAMKLEDVFGADPA